MNSSDEYFDKLCSYLEKKRYEYDLVCSPDFSGHSFRPEDVIRLVGVIKCNANLSELNLTGCSIDFPELKAIFDVLQYSNISKVYANYLNVKDIETPDFGILVELFKNTNVTTLDLSVNRIGEGIDSIIRVLGSTEITTLYINGTHVTDEQKTQIRDILRINIAKYALQFWSPERHISFANEDDSCHEMVITSLLCNSVFSTRLPFHIWVYILSFWQREHFHIEFNEDDMSDGEVDFGEDDEDSEDEEDSEDDEDGDDEDA